MANLQRTMLRLLPIYLFWTACYLNADGKIATFRFGTTVFLLARSLGRLSLSVYRCHVFYMWIYQTLVPKMPGRTAVLFILIEASATAAATGPVRVPWLRRFTT